MQPWVGSGSVPAVLSVTPMCAQDVLFTAYSDLFTAYSDLFTAYSNACQ